MRRLALALAAAASLLLALPTPAHAGLLIGADGDAAFPLTTGSTGFSVTGRVGYNLDLTLLRLIPEVGGGVLAFGAESETIGKTLGARGFGGVRLAIGTTVEPVVYVHAGYARLDTAVAAGDGTTGGGGAAGALFLEAGAGLEFTLLPILDLGVHGSYTTFDGGEAEWLLAGAHLNLSF